MTPHLPCAAVDCAWRQGRSRRINCQANQCWSRLRVWIPPSLVKSIYSRVRTEPVWSVRHVRRLCSFYIFLRYRAHSRRAPSKPVIDLSFLTASSLLQSIKKTAAKKAKLFEAASERSSLKQSKAHEVSISLIEKIAILELIRTNNFCVLKMSFCEVIELKKLLI